MKVYDAANLRNLALIGHGHAGKTTLVSAMLYTAGAAPRLGRVDDGSAATDYDEEEIARKMSISTGMALSLIHICEDTVQAGGVNLVEAGLRFDDTGVVDQGGDGAELARGLVEEADHFLFVADVGLEGDGGASVVADGGDYFFGGGLVAVVVDADVESAGGGALGGGGADAVSYTHLSRRD